MGQLIIGSFFSDSTYHAAKKAMGVFKKVDNVSQGYKPTGDNPAGVLMVLKSSPLAFYDYPTLNEMVFRKALWNGLLNDADLTTRMRLSRSFWGESGHQDSLEIKIPLISNKVTEFWTSDDKNNMVLGDVSVLDTPQGNIVYSLLQDGDIGISSRGWGDLVPINSGKYQEFSSSDFYSKPNMKVVNEDGYIASSWDFVTVPAVPQAMLTIRQHLDRFKDAKHAVRSSLERYPNADYAHLKKILEPEIKRRTFVMSGPAQSPNQDIDLGEEKPDDNGDFFKFPRGTASPESGKERKLPMSRNGWDPQTVAKMGTKRYTDIVLPQVDPGDSGPRIDEEEVPEQMEGQEPRRLLQNSTEQAMTMDRLPEDKQRDLFDRMVEIELGRALELRQTEQF